MTFGMILAAEMCDGPPGGAKTGFPATDIRREADDPGPAKGSVRGFFPSCKKCKICFHIGYRFYSKTEIEIGYAFTLMIFTTTLINSKAFKVLLSSESSNYRIIMSSRYCDLSN